MSRMSRRALVRRGLAGAALLLAAPLAACGGGGATGSGASGAGKGGAQAGIAYKSDARTLDPQMHTDTTTHVMLSQMFETLLQMGRDGKFQPLLATSWAVVNDRTWRLKLRDGVKFHNGEPLTAETVKFALERFIDPSIKSPATPFYRATFDHVEVKDSLTVDLVTKNPSAIALTLLQQAWIVPRQYLKEVGNDGFAAKPVGTGPYKFVEWVKDDHLTVAAQDGYWGARPAITRLTFKPIPEDAARIAALQKGEQDIIAALPLDRKKEIEGNQGLRAPSRDGQMIYLGLDTLRYEPFMKKEVRQALNYAIDWDAVIRDLLLGQATRLNGAFFPVTPGYRADVKPFPYDPQKARALLSAGGYPNGFPMRLDVPVGTQSALKFKEVAEAVAAALDKVGVKVSLNILDPAAGADLYNAKKMQAYLFPWASTPESGRHVEALFYTKARGYYYSNPRADALIEAYMQTLDPEKRKAAGEAVFDFLRDECPWVFMYVEKDIYGVRNHLRWEPNPYDYLIHGVDLGLRA